MFRSNNIIKFVGKSCKLKILSVNFQRILSNSTITGIDRIPKDHQNLIEDNFSLKINNISIRNYLHEILRQHHDNNNKSSKVNELQNKYVQNIIHILQQRKDIIENIHSLQELLQNDDKAIKEMAEEDYTSYKKNLEDVEQSLILNLTPNTNEDLCNSVILEVNSGVGGQEAMLFAKELFDMYCNFVEYKGWQMQLGDYTETDLGGLRHGSILIDGQFSFQLLKHEAGVHRVQRIPSTEKSGRVHTSTVSVLVLPQPTDIQIKIEPKDLKIETKRASGAGGQHVNTTDSAVRMVHLPTGISTEVQVDRSQIKNKQIALIKLRTMLYQKQLDEQNAKSENLRKSQVKSNFRNEKIRTYNFSQDRISDHRIQGENIHNIKVFFEGNHMLENLILKVQNTVNLEKLLTLLNNCNKRSKTR